MGLDNKEIRKFISSWIIWNLNEDTKSFLKSDLYKKLRNELSKKICIFLNSNEFRNNIYQLAEETLKENEKRGKTFKQILPSGFENSLKVLVYNKSPEIAAVIKGYINDIKFKSMIRTEINKLLVSVNPMVAKFINGDSIQVKIMNSLNGFFDNNDNIISVVMLLNNKIDDANNKPIKEVLDYMPYEGKNAIVKATVDSVLNLFSCKEFIKNIENQIHNKMLCYSTIGDLIKSIGLSEEELLNIIDKNVSKYISL